MYYECANKSAVQVLERLLSAVGYVGPGALTVFD